ncbi:hypothetical protein BDZ89DRAFT_1055587, partial [Hymenopellis radicata]
MSSITNILIFLQTSVSCLPSPQSPLPLPVSRPPTWAAQMYVSSSPLSRLSFHLPLQTPKVGAEAEKAPRSPPSGGAKPPPRRPRRAPLAVERSQPAVKRN